MNANNADNLKALKDKVTTHFTNEEATMTAKNYDDLAAHKEIHKGFVAKLGALSAPLDAAAVDFAKSW